MRLSPWGRVVAISALLVVGGAVALAVGALASSQPRRRHLPRDGAGRGPDLRRRRRRHRDRRRRPARRRRGAALRALLVRPRGRRSSRASRAPTYRVHARCPTTLLGPCTVDHRVIVPDNVALDIRTSGGHVSLRGYRGSARIVTGSGAIDISGYCGNSLDARAGSGDITVEAACAPPRLSLRSGSGSIHAVLPAGRYDLDAESTSGSESVRGLTPRADAPYTVQVLSGVGRRLGRGPVVIASLELDRRLVRAGHAVAYLVTTLPVTLLAIPAVALLILGAALSVAGIGLPLLLAAAAACRRLVRLGSRRGQPLAGCAGAADPEPRARDGQLVPAVARPAVRPRPVADGDASGAAAGAGRRAGRGRARAGVRAGAAAPARHRRAGGLRRGRLRRAVGARAGARARVARAGAARRRR